MRISASLSLEVCLPSFLYFSFVRGKTELTPHIVNRSLFGFRSRDTHFLYRSAIHSNKISRHHIFCLASGKQHLRFHCIVGSPTHISVVCYNTTYLYLCIAWIWRFVFWEQPSWHVTLAAADSLFCRCRIFIYSLIQLSKLCFSMCMLEWVSVRTCVCERW